MDDTLPYAVAIRRGPNDHDGAALVGIVVDASFGFDSGAEFASEVTAHEVSGGSYARLTATGRVDQVGDEWKLFLDDLTTTNLSGIDYSGVVWVSDAADDASRPLIGFAPDSGSGTNPYAPSWPSGFLAWPIETINDRLLPTSTSADAGKYPKRTEAGWVLADGTGTGSASVFVYDASGDELGSNVYTDWATLYADLTATSGPRWIQIPSNQVVPAEGMPEGGWDLGQVHLVGVNALPSHIKALEFGDGVILANPPASVSNGLVLWSTNTTDPICTITDHFSMEFRDWGAAMASYKEFFACSTSPGVVVEFRFHNGSGFVRPDTFAPGADSYEALSHTGTGSVAVDDVAGSSALQNNTIRGTGAVYRLRYANAAPVNYPGSTGNTQTNAADFRVDMLSKAAITSASLTTAADWPEFVGASDGDEKPAQTLLDTLASRAGGGGYSTAADVYDALATAADDGYPSRKDDPSGGELLYGSDGGTPITMSPYWLWLAYLKALADAAYQPLDGDLTSIAALSTTSFGRSLLEAANAAALRTLAGLGGAATLSVGTTAGTVAAGDDSRITGATPQARTLAGLDLTTNRSASDIKTALSLAKGDVGLGSVTNDAQLKIASNLSDLANAATARTNLGVAIGADVQAYRAFLANFDFGTVQIPVLGPATTNGTWVLSTSGGNGIHMANSSAASGDYIQWNNVPSGTGTYTLGIVYQQGASGGQVQLSIDGSDVGSTYEMYAASTTLVRDVSLTGLSLTAGLHNIKAISSAKNGSSSGYTIRILSMTLYRTA